MNNEITKRLLNSLYGKSKMSPKYENGYHFKDNRGNEYEILERQWNSGMYLYYVIDTKTGFINILSQGSIDNILGGSNAKKPRKKQTRSLL